MKKFVLLLFVLLSAMFGGYWLNDYMKADPPSPAAITQLPTHVKFMGALLGKEAVISEIHAQPKLIVLEAYVTEEITIDDSYLEMGLFKKTQNITFTALGSFAVDLGAVTAQDVEIDYFTQEIMILIDPPELQPLALLEDLTQYHEAETGLLRFGDIKISPYDYDAVVVQAKEIMKTKLLEDETFNAACDNAVIALQSLLAEFIRGAGYKEFDICVAFR